MSVGLAYRDIIAFYFVRSTDPYVLINDLRVYVVSIFTNLSHSSVPFSHSSYCVMDLPLCKD